MTQESLGVTIGDVAERAGVSIATVSRVNGRYGVAPTTLSRVRAVIDNLGYPSVYYRQKRSGGRSHLEGRPCRRRRQHAGTFTIATSDGVVVVDKVFDSPVQISDCGGAPPRKESA